MEITTYTTPTPKTHAPVRLIPKRDLSAGYRMMVPRGWGTATRIGGVQFEQGRAEPIGFFVESDRDGAGAIVVSTTRLPVELGLEDFVRGQCAHEGWQVQDMHWFPAAGAMRLEALAQKGRGVASSRRRIVVFADNGRVVMHSATAPVSSWARLDPLLWGSADSFELLVPSGRTQFEAWEEHSAGGLRVKLPVSWRARFAASAPELSALDANLNHGEAGQLHGYVRVKGRQLRRSRPVEELLDIVDYEIRKKGIVPALRKPPRALVSGAEVPEGWLGTFFSDVQIFGGLGEALYGFKFVDGVELSVVSLSPSLKHDRMGCLRTRRAFEIALETAGAR